MTQHPFKLTHMRAHTQNETNTDIAYISGQTAQTGTYNKTMSTSFFFFCLMNLFFRVTIIFRNRLLKVYNFLLIIYVRTRKYLFFEN